MSAVKLYGGDYEHTLDMSGERQGIDVEYIIRPLLEIFEGMLNDKDL